MLTQLLYEYELAFGQCINFSKFALYVCSNVPVSRDNILYEILSVCKVVDFEQYLGLPSLFTHSKQSGFRSIKERICNVIQG